MSMYVMIKKKKHEDKLFKDAQKGFKFRKHGRKGKPHERLVSISKDFDHISWKEVGKANGRNVKYPLEKFNSVQKGADTKVFKRNKKLEEGLCLSLIGNERTLDLECTSVELRDQWHDIFDCVLQRVVQLRDDPQKIKNQEADIDKVTKVLNKFTFDIQNETWKVSKLLTKNANFTDQEFGHLALALNQNPIVKTLDLTGIKMNDLCVTSLAKGLEHATALTYLSLSENEITSDGVNTLSKIFKDKPSYQLKVLDLSHNSISDDGVEILARSLYHNSSLEELNLDSNQVGDLGAEALADLLNDEKAKRVLKKLRLNDNALQNEGIMRLSECLKSKETPLQFVTLARNQIAFPQPRKDTFEEYDDEARGANGDEEFDHSLEINLFLAVDASDYAETVLLLLKGADPNVQNEEDGKTPLHLVSLRGDMVMLEFLIAHPYIDLNSIDDNGTTPIHNAMMHGQYDVVKILLDKGADHSIPDNHRKTCLHIAAEQGSKVMCKLLVENFKADITAVTDQEQTVLHFATMGLHKDLVQFLLAEHAKTSGTDNDDTLPFVNWQDINGETALHKCLSSTSGSKNDQLELAKELVKHGADVAIEDSQGRSPLHDVADDIKQLLLNETRLHASKLRK